MDADLDATFAQLAKLADGQLDCYDEIFALVKKVASAGRLTGGGLRSGLLLYRARLNDPGRQFRHRDEISYVSDRTMVRGYGRANKPGQPMFYCSDDAMTALLETIDGALRRNVNVDGSVTLGMWRVVRPLTNMVLVLNSEVSLKRLFPNGSEAAAAMQVLDENRHRWKYNQWRSALDYCVDRFAERVTDLDTRRYRITTAIFEATVGDASVGGIAYPSALSESLGINFALLPASVNHYLKLVDVVRFDFKKEGTSVELRERRLHRLYPDGAFEFRE